MRRPFSKHHLQLHPPSEHPIFGIYGVTVLTLALDPMHIIDHHGVASHILANSLFTLVYGWPDRPKTRCDLERMRSFHTHVHMHIYL